MNAVCFTENVSQAFSFTPIKNVPVPGAPVLCRDTPSPCFAPRTGLHWAPAHFPKITWACHSALLSQVGWASFRMDEFLQTDAPESIDIYRSIRGNQSTENKTLLKDPLRWPSRGPAPGD
ncbi:Hypothetical predicted protein [Marmota monax]|uniref:Uncharacterized protein n=1 Tax=Marmota monax TaxID=9995 RepID=A0A5E4A4J6_MARMO|nr:hypothetical protein GHT09_006436 [Marmota monax]VTJ52038.1 Hypothetical predicted protein [Marmota monax]